MKKTAKPKIALYWCSSCGGCEEAIIDLDESFLNLAMAVDIVFWPCAMDFKTSDVRALKNGEIDISFINGAIRTSEQESMAKLLREKSSIVVAFGMCAYQGGIPALANLTNKEAILNRAYLESETVINDHQVIPKSATDTGDIILSLPDFYESVLKLNDVIDVDYFIPGCPPTANIIQGAFNALFSGNLPPKKSILAPNQALCKSCSRNSSKPDYLRLEQLKRIHQIVADPDQCFLNQGILCMGPATRDGCGQVCIDGNMPCTGCFGPLAGTDQGAKLLSAFAGLFDPANSNDDITEQIPDPAGTFYRYGLAASLLGRKRKEPVDD